MSNVEVVSLLSDSEDEPMEDIPPPVPGARRAARKKRQRENSKAKISVSSSSSSPTTSTTTTTSTTAKMTTNSLIAKHVRTTVQSVTWGSKISSVYDSFLVPKLTKSAETKNDTEQQFITWTELHKSLSDNDYIVLSSHALTKYELNINSTDSPSPAKKRRKSRSATSSSTTIYTLLQDIVPAIAALGKEQNPIAATSTPTPKPSATNATGQPTYWKAGTGYGGANNMNAGDMSLTFASQSEAQAREKTKDGIDQTLMEAAYTILSTSTDVLVHPVVSGIILRDLVPRLSNYLSTSFDDMCDRELLFTSVLKVVAFLSKQGETCQHIMTVAPDEVTGKKQLNNDDEDDDTPPPPSISQLLDVLDRQALVFAAALGGRKNSNEAKACLRLTAAISACKVNDDGGTTTNGNGKTSSKKRRLADAVGGNSSSSSSSSSTAVDLTSRSGAQQDSYVNVMNNLKITTASILNGTEYPYHYRNEAKQVKSSVQKRLIRIGKELASLSNSLPIHNTSSVMVCIDEERPDCLKAIIVGPADTPYENGLFEFDIFLPADYPNVPPKVILTTTGGGRIRFNPNLYAEGKVCLSLLGTWKGPGWHRKCTLLQVLISIQSLILVDEPFFNEPGFERHQGTETGARSSAIYNQRIREATIRYAMIPHLMKPEKSPFASIIREHFARRSLSLRLQCEKWCKQLRRANRPGVVRNHVNVFAGGVQSSTPATLEAATASLYANVNALITERSAKARKARGEKVEVEKESSSSSSSSSMVVVID